MVIAAVAFFLVKTKPEPKAELKETVPVTVAVKSVETRDIQPTRVVSGRLRAATKLGLHFEVNGRVKSRLAEPGEQIKAGEVLLALEEGDYQDMVIDAQAQLDQERAAIERDRRLLTIAERNTQLQAGEVKRLERLSSSSLAAQSLLDDSKKLLLQLNAEQENLDYSVNNAKSRMALRQSALRRAKRNEQRTRLVAPFDSVINSVDANVGDFVTTAQVVIEVLEQGLFDLAIEVDGDTASALSLQQTVPVSINGRIDNGTIVALQSDPDSETFTHAVRIRVSDERLLPGTLAIAELPLVPQENVMMVPVTAILQEEGAAYVFRVVDNRLERVRIEVGSRDGNDQVVSGAITNLDALVSRDVAALSDGQVITLVQ
ncbi:MAG: hypothetical protein COC05_02615 [Gammaproteobacteria bacterium]|nr:MAG: hypothetical protein COC05_02615 [Gammaproteobacteria bacterium]